MAPGHSFSEDEEDDPLTCASGGTLEGGTTSTTSGTGISHKGGKLPVGSGSRPREGQCKERSGPTGFAFPPPSPAGSLEDCLLSPSIQGSTASPSANSQEGSAASTSMSFHEGLRDTPDMVNTQGLSTATSSVVFLKGSTAGGDESAPDPSVRHSLRAIVLMASGHSFSDNEGEEEDNQEEAKAGGNEVCSSPSPSPSPSFNGGNGMMTAEQTRVVTSTTPEMTSPLLISTPRKASTLTKTVSGVKHK